MRCRHKKLPRIAKNLLHSGGSPSLMPRYSMGTYGSAGLSTDWFLVCYPLAGVVCSTYQENPVSTPK